MGLIEQEVSAEPEIEIPEEVREIYKLWRPTPLYRARRLERALDTPAHIYYKYEGVSPAGSHKPNTAVAQAYFNQREGVRKLATETGAGQWGSALALACRLFDLECEVFMVGVSYDQKPYRRAMMETWGATVHRSPSELTDAGRAQAEHSTGSLGIAISEAVETAAGADDTNYALGSVLNHVCLHQTVIGQEALQQLELAGEYPEVVVGCVGGGSNFAGLAYPLIRKRIREGLDTRFLAAEPAACPTLTRGAYRYDFGDTVGPHPADADVHARATTSSRPRCTPAACATTATRPAFPGSSRRAWSRRARSPRPPPSTPPSDSPRPRASSPPLSPRMRCGSSSTRRRPRRRPARSG